MSLDVFIIGLYMVVTLVMGILSGLNIKNMRSYAVGSRPHSTLALVATMTATRIGGGSIIGITEHTFTKGLSFTLTTGIAILVRQTLTVLFIAAKTARFKDALSIGDIMERLYGRSARVITGVCAMILCMGYLGAQISATGHVFEAFLGLPHFWGVLLGSGIVVVYAAFGGIQSVTSTDLMQFFTLIIVIPLLAVFGILALGGPEHWLDNIPAKNWKAYAGEGGFLPYLPLLLAYCIPPMDPPTVQRYLMAGCAKRARRIALLSACLLIPVVILSRLIGVLCLSLMPDCSPSAAFPEILKAILPAGVLGFSICGILAIIMSTADSFLNSASIAFTHDVVGALSEKFKQPKAALKLAQISTVVIGLGSIAAALSAPNILDIVINVLSFWTPIVGVPLIAGIVGIRIPKPAVYLGMGAGLLFCVYFKYFVAGVANFTGLFSGIVANIVVLIVGRGYYAWRYKENV